MPKILVKRKMQMLNVYYRTYAISLYLSLLFIQTSTTALKSEINESSNEMKIKEIQQPNRPQTPQGPFHYKQEEVWFENKASEIILAGTLTMPQGKEPFPVVVLISGMGPNDRDYGMLGHKLFLVIADHITKQGIAVLRYDKRGIGKSTGIYNTSLTSQDFTNDVKAAIDYLKSRSDIDPQKIGVLGHSEGGMIAQMVAVQIKISFIILLAPAGLLTNIESIVEQAACQLRADGASMGMISEDKKIRHKLLEIVKEEADFNIAAKNVHKLFENYWSNLSESLQMEAEQLPFAFTISKADQFISMLNSLWYRFFLKYIPSDVLKRISIPILALNGDYDFITSSKKNLPIIAKAFNENGNRDCTISELPMLNHWFQECQTGALKEYGALEQTISPIVLNIITNWILERTK